MLDADMKSRKMNISLTDFLKEESLQDWMLYVLIREAEVATITWLCVDTILILCKTGYTHTLAKKSDWNMDDRVNEAQLPERAQWKMLPGNAEFPFQHIEQRLQS